MRLALRLAPLLLLAGCGGSVSRVPYYRTAELTPEWLLPEQARAPELHRVGPFRMLDQHGDVVTERAILGRVTIVQFFFTGCRDVCPTTTNNLARLLAGAADPRIQLLSYSVTPARDSVMALRQYAELHRLSDPRWHLLTGAAEATLRLARESYFIRLGDGASYGVASIAHTESLLLLDGAGHLRGVYAGTLPLELQRLREDLALLLDDDAR
jgi:protein SCO1/2